jgi:hypothetical protein
LEDALGRKVVVVTHALLHSLVQKEEILFFGPDEGTADLMNWASNHARQRKAAFWKAFTTGKSREFGGVHGRETQKIRQNTRFVLESTNKQVSGVAGHAVKHTAKHTNGVFLSKRGVNERWGGCS